VTEVVIYTRPGCHLCDEAREILERVSEEAPFVLRERDISVDDALHARYLERIPVVTINGEEAFELEVDEAGLRERLVRVHR
jgi:glutaredoxin